MSFTPMAPPPPPPRPGSPEAKLKARLKRYHRKEIEPAPPKKEKEKATLPNGRYFHKVPHKSLKEGYNPARKKLRGPYKKEFARCMRMYKTMRPWGDPRASKPASGPDHHSVIFPFVVCKLMNMDPRPASRYLTLVRKRLQKPRGEIITLREFCSVTPWTEEEVIPYLK